MGLEQQRRQQQLYAVSPPESGGRPPSAAIERTEELEVGQSVTPLEAKMFRALQRMDADDAHDHLVKIRRLTEAQLTKVVKLDGVPWLATEVNLLGEFPEDSRPAFRQRARDRARRLSNAGLARAEPHPEPLFVNTRRVGSSGAVSWLGSSADPERVCGAATRTFVRV